MRTCEEITGVNPEQYNAVAIPIPVEIPDLFDSDGDKTWFQYHMVAKDFRVFCKDMELLHNCTWSAATPLPIFVCGKPTTISGLTTTFLFNPKYADYTWMRWDKHTETLYIGTASLGEFIHVPVPIGCMDQLPHAYPVTDDEFKTLQNLK